MASKLGVKFVEDDQQLTARVFEDFESDSGSCPLEEEIEEDEIAHPPVKEPAVIACHLLLRLIEDAITMLRTLGFITEDLVQFKEPDPVGGAANNEPIYPHLNELEDQLDKELLAKLKYYADRRKQWKQATDDIDEAEKATKKLKTTTWSLCCYFIVSEYARDQLEQLKIQQNASFLLLCEALEKFRMLLMRRFSATLEEEKAIEEYRIGCILREQKAKAKNEAMARKLKDDQKKRADALAEYLTNERLLQQDKDNSVILAKQMEEQLKADCAALEAQETAAFDAENTMLALENDVMGEALFDLQMKDRDLELQMRGKKGQSIEEVANLIWEYEDDITVRTHKLKEIIGEHDVVAEHLTKMEAHFAEKARLAAIKEEEAALMREANVAKRRKKWLPYYAAKRIQRYWKRYLQKKKALAGDADGGKGKDKKGGKGGGKKGGKKKKK